MREWKRTGEVRCWNCLSWVSNNELENADGICPNCDHEIDTTEDPYSDNDCEVHDE